MTLISKSTSIKILLGLMVASGIMTYGFKANIAKAAVGVTGLTGKYSCVSNRNFAPTNAYLQNSATVGANFLWLIDFDAHTMSGIIFANSNWGQNNATATTVTASATFTEAIGPVTGSYQLTQAVTVVGGGTNTIKSNILIANSGNTFFYSMDGSTNPTPETGVCQKQ